MKSSYRMTVASFAVMILSACATAKLSAQGKDVLPIASAPPSDCRNLGTVIGQGGGTFGGTLVKNDELVEYATNDALNKAAKKGATHLQLGSPALGGSEGTTSTATVSGVAYQCPKGVAGTGVGTGGSGTAEPH